VHSKEQFQKILVEDFNYIVSPIVFNSHILLESEYFVIDKVFGTPFPEETTSESFKIGCQCASDESSEKGTKGGMILIKLKERLTSKEDPSKKIKLTLFYENLEGKKFKSTQEIDFQKVNGFENQGIHKGILLNNYVNFVHEFLDFKTNKIENDKNDGVSTNIKKLTPEFEEKNQEIKNFKKYFSVNSTILKDDTLQKELDSLERLKYL
jgi:Ca-activated chloride channel homolog